MAGQGWVGTHELAWWTGGSGGVPFWLTGAGLVEGGSGRRGKGSGGGCKGFGSGRDTGPRNGANFAVCRIFVVFNAYKKKKNGVF